jgi:sugar-specific transcriptional regulator TrmB
MLEHDESVPTLYKLGLTVLQAKVYIALAKLGTSTGRTTAKTAQVAPQDVYRILGELLEKGLVEKIITKPTLYKATPIEDGLAILLQNKKDEYIETEKKAKAISKSFYANQRQEILHENTQFLISSETSLLSKTHEKLADATKNSIDFVLPEKANEKGVIHNFQYLKMAAMRCVKIRVIALEGDVETTSESPDYFSKNPFFELRYLPETEMPFGMHIFDKKEMTIAISQKRLPSLWTNNPNVIKLAEVYFKDTWKRSSKTN